MPLAPNGGTPVVARSGLVTHAVAGPPAAPVRQIVPWKESEMYTLPTASNASAFGPAAGPPGITVKGAAAPLNGSTRSTVLLPKSTTSSSPVSGWNAVPRSRLLEPAIATTRLRCPCGLKTYSFPGGVPVTAKVVT
jgi:hypothetical protein